jgi:hypothetical protein
MTISLTLALRLAWAQSLELGAINTDDFSDLKPE